MTDGGAPERRVGRWQWVVALAAITLALGAGAGWAIATVLRPADDPLAATGFTFVSVQMGEVRSDMTLNTVAEWLPEQAGTNQATGVVTTVDISAGEEVTQGTALFSVGLRPVVAAQGAIPAFRAISAGATGADVAQLQEMLRSLGFYAGAVDGKAESGTDRAIKAWQKSLALEQSGSVELGDVIFLPELPSRVTLNAELVSRGATLDGGETVVSALPPQPAFVLPVTDSQAAATPIGTKVEILSPEGSLWTGYTADQSRDEESQTVNIRLSGQDGGSICGDQCADVPVTGRSLLTSSVVIVPATTGLVVPSSALVTTSSGQIAVIDSSGAVIPVTPIASARGMSVIEGVSEKTLVRVPGDAAEEPSS